MNMKQIVLGAAAAMTASFALAGPLQTIAPAQTTAGYDDSYFVVKDTTNDTVGVTNLNLFVDQINPGYSFGIYAFTETSGVASINNGGTDKLQVLGAGEFGASIVFDFATQQASVNDANGNNVAGPITLGGNGRDFGVYVEKNGTFYYSHEELNAANVGDVLTTTVTTQGWMDSTLYWDIAGEQVAIRIGLHDALPVPEPGTLALLGLGLAGLGVARRRTKKTA